MVMKHLGKCEATPFFTSRRGVVLLCLTVLWVMCIFSFSLQPGDVSGGTSGALVQWMLERLRIESLTPEAYDLLHTLVRKCGHFTEYMVLGVLCTLTLRETSVRCSFFAALGCCAAAACADETIQLFVAGRSGQIADVLLDSVGAAAGIAWMMLLFAARKRRSIPIR